ncbi:MAG: hypothetical protein KDK70_44255, partial [Myxococcales bacterium]|nr:hypothetical protein [Myxococcales bacterium]
GLACDTHFGGGYCGARDCGSDADCPGDSLCIDGGEFTYCARTCTAPSDCTFCRPDDVAGACTSNVQYVGAGGSDVCVVAS